MAIIFPELLSVPLIKCSEATPPTTSKNNTVNQTHTVSISWFQFSTPNKRLLILKQRGWVSGYTNDYLTATEFGDDYVILPQQISSLFQNYLYMPLSTNFIIISYEVQGIRPSLNRYTLVLQHDITLQNAQHWMLCGCRLLSVLVIYSCFAVSVLY